MTNLSVESTKKKKGDKEMHSGIKQLMTLGIKIDQSSVIEEAQNKLYEGPCTE